MANRITPRKPNNNFSRQQSPPLTNRDQYTNRSNPKKSEAFFIDTKNDERSIDNHSPFQTNSPPIRRRTSPRNTPPELFHLTASDSKYEVQSPSPRSPILVNNNRITPLPPLENLLEPKVEMYHLVTVDEPFRQSSAKANDIPITNDRFPNDNETPVKPTMYFIESVEQENTPNTSVLLSRRSEPESYVSNRNNFPTGYPVVATSTRYVPLTQSKAAESIQRSMNRYRFAAY